MQKSRDEPTISKPIGKNRHPPPASLLTAYDLKIVFELIAVLPFAWLAPVGSFGFIAEVFARLGSVTGMADAQGLGAKINRMANGYLDEESALAAGFELEAWRYQDYMQILRANGPGDWRPDIRVEGFDIVEGALAHGQGAILWISHFTFGTLLTAMALQRAGLQPRHATLSSHGFSWSRFGRVFLNPIRCRIEERYLERIIVDSNAAVSGSRTLMKTLASNGLVTITAGAWVGRQIHELSFLNGKIRFATGATSLARSTGAALIPVHGLWDGDAKTFRVIAEPPLPVPREGDRRRLAEDVMSAYLDRLRPWALRFPGQWRGWARMTACEDPGGGKICGGRAR